MYWLYDLTCAGGEVISDKLYGSNCLPLSVNGSDHFPAIVLNYTGNAIVVSKRDQGIDHIEIFNSTGQLLFSYAFSKTSEVDVSKFAKQLLIVRVYNGREHISKKIITQ